MPAGHSTAHASVAAKAAPECDLAHAKPFGVEKRVSEFGAQPLNGLSRRDSGRSHEAAVEVARALPATAAISCTDQFRRGSAATAVKSGPNGAALWLCRASISLYCFWPPARRIGTTSRRATRAANAASWSRSINARVRSIPAVTPGSIPCGPNGVFASCQTSHGRVPPKRISLPPRAKPRQRQRSMCLASAQDRRCWPLRACFKAAMPEDTGKPAICWPVSA